MPCPRCQCFASHALTACGECGFTLSDVLAELGSVVAAIDPIMDVAHCLRKSERTALEASLDDFERRFPQVFLSVFLGLLPPRLTVGEAGFWLLNQGVRKKRELICDNRFGIILLVDPAAHVAGLSFGYALEPLLQASAASILQKNSHFFWHGDYANGLSAVIKALDRTLRSVGKSSLRKAPGGPTAVMPGLGLDFVGGGASGSPQSAQQGVAR